MRDRSERVLIGDYMAIPKVPVVLGGVAKFYPPIPFSANSAQPNIATAEWDRDASVP